MTADLRRDWTGWVYSDCTLKGHPAKAHWHPPVGQLPPGVRPPCQHVYTNNPPGFEGKSCGNCGTPEPR